MDICNNCKQHKDLHQGRMLYCTNLTTEVFTKLRCNYRYSCKCEPLVERGEHPELGYLCAWHWRVSAFSVTINEDPIAKVDIELDDDLVSQQKDEQEA